MKKILLLIPIITILSCGVNKDEEVKQDKAKLQEDKATLDQVKTSGNDSSIQKAKDTVKADRKELLHDQIKVEKRKENDLEGSEIDRE